MPGYGGGGYGGMGFGGGPSEFDLFGAVGVDFQTVDLTFSNAIDPTSSVAVSPASFSFSPALGVLAAVVQSSNVIRVYTTTQQAVTYTVTVDTALDDIFGLNLVINQASFDGTAVSPQYLVSGLQARSDCQGLGIFLSWTNPDSPTNLLIVRRLRTWPFDLTDPGYDVVYSGPAITSFDDTGVKEPITNLTVASLVGANRLTVASTTGYSSGDKIRVESVTGTQTFEIVPIASVADGTHLVLQTVLQNAYPVGARVSESTPLQPQTFYYYLVLASQTVSPPYEYDVNDASRAFALSIDVYNSQSTFFDVNMPSFWRAQDAVPTSQGGGGGFLAKWTAMMGCWLNLLRGNANAVQLLNDPDKAPYNALTALNEQLGIQPEGQSYDFDIVRRPLTSLVFVYKRKGSCPGIVETVSMFTKWDAVCVNFGDASCNGGASDLTTWDGQSVALTYGPTLSVTQNVISADGTATFTDPGETWVAHQWLNGSLRGWIGDIACVQDNPSDGHALTTQPPPVTTTLSAAAVATATSLSVASTYELTPDMTIQLTDTVPTTGVFEAEIVEILAITSAGVPGTISIKGPGLTNAYHSGSMVSIGKSIVRSAYLGSSGAVGTLDTLTDSQAYWVDHQWVGYYLKDNAGTIFAITDNVGGDALTVVGTPASGTYQIAKSFSGGSAQLTYKLGVGVHTNIEEPTFCSALIGTIYSPYTPLYNGPGLNLHGVWGPNDVGVYILGNIPQAVGRAGSVTGAVFSLDPNQPAPTTNAWVGDFLNPNQNQEQLFEILANTPTTVTVAGDVGSLVVVGQYYYVLTPRDRNRYTRLTQRLKTEFTDTDARPHVLFV